MLLDNRIPLRYVFNKIKYDVLCVLFLSFLFHAIKLFFSHLLPPIPITLASVLGTGISLILAFKLNQSYDRWWEARKVWGAIVNDSRSLILELKGFIDDDHFHLSETGSIFKRMAYRQIAWCYCLGQSLRGQNPLENLDEFLSLEDMDILKTQNNKPLYLLMLHMTDLKKLFSSQSINHFQQIQIDNTITRLCDSMGKSERINSTVFPATYRRFIHFFIYLFLVVLSIALVETIGIYEIPLLTLIASTFFLIEKTAKHMQDPFRNKPTDTAVTAIARNIEINLKQLLHEKEVPKPLPPHDFYLM